MPLTSTSKRLAPKLTKVTYSDDNTLGSLREKVASMYH